jgi:hypothetical protein
MGFIPQVSTKTLYAYLTPLGRQYILDGDKADFQVAYFTLHDDDVNYFISSNISAGTTYYTLQSGFVPDITGDADTCIKSIAAGTNVNTMSTLSGSSILDTTTNKLTVGRIGTDGNINTRVCTIQSSISKLEGGSLNPASTTYTVSPFNVVIAPPSGDTVAVNGTEIANTQFYVRIVNIGGAGNFTINGTSGTIILINPTVVSTPINITYQKLEGQVTQSGSVNIVFDIQIVPYRSFIDLGANSAIRYTASYTTSGGSGGTGGVNANV